MNIFAIETSCDDTCAAIVKATGRKRPRFEILSDVRSSQVKIHAPYGGVVPNLAARAHQENMNIVLKETFRNAKVPIANANKNIDLIAVTTHPGLIPCLLIGTNVARTLAWIWNKPIIGANHLEGHLYVNWLEPINVNPKSEIRNPKQIKFPAVALIVSGGHTQLVLMKNYGKFRIIGETRDDAAGEAFDKVAKLLGLGFPGGPTIAAEAAKIPNPKSPGLDSPSRRGGQIPNKFKISAFAKAAADKQNSKFKISLPRPMIDSKDYDFSFSGLKTAVLYLVKERFMKNGRLTIDKKQLAGLCAEFQQAVIDVLIAKTLKAAKAQKAETVILGGGVGANKELRKQLEAVIKKELPDVTCLLSPIKYSTDNAVMIAIAGYYRYLEGKAKTWREIKAKPTL